MPLFGKSSKSPSEVVKNLKESLASLEKLSSEGGKKVEKAQDEVSKHLFTISSLLFCHDGDQLQQSDIVLAQLSQEMYNSALIPALLRNLARLEFEARKEAAEIFKHVLRRQIGTRTPTVEYIVTCDEILVTLCRGYRNQDICHNTGHMLRECLLYEPLAKALLTFEYIQDFFTYVENPQFDIAADAFSTFRDLLTRHKSLASQCIVANYEDFFLRYNVLLQSSNFITKMNSLNLLSELLYDRNNLSVMKKYVDSEDNLKLIMNLMLDSSSKVQMVAISIFKIFLLNPKKSDAVQTILLRNKELLLTFLENLNMLDDDERFLNERSSIMTRLKELQTDEE